MSRKKTRVLAAQRYNTYKKLYRERQKTLRRHGYEMEEKMLDFESYKYQYENIAQDIRDSTNGTTNNVNINRLIVKNQAYDTSYRQMIGLRKAMIEIGEEPPNLMKMRKDERYREGLWDILGDRYEELRSQGYSGKRAKEYISTMYFNSEPT